MAAGAKTNALLSAGSGLFASLGNSGAYGGPFGDFLKQAQTIVPGAVSADAQAALAKPANLGTETIAPNTNGAIRANVSVAQSGMNWVKAHPWPVAAGVAVILFLLWRR